MALAPLTAPRCLAGTPDPHGDRERSPGAPHVPARRHWVNRSRSLFPLFLCRSSRHLGDLAVSSGSASSHRHQVPHTHLCRDSGGDLPKGGRRGCLRIGDDEWLSLVAALANARIDGNPAQKRNAPFRGRSLGSAGIEDVIPCPAAWTDKVAHIFNEARIGTPAWLHILRAFSATRKAARCGAVTITVPVRGTDCDRVSGTSPVPGGRSTIK